MLYLNTYLSYPDWWYFYSYYRFENLTHLTTILPFGFGKKDKLNFNLFFICTMGQEVTPPPSPLFPQGMRQLYRRSFYRMIIFILCNSAILTKFPFIYAWYGLFQVVVHVQNMLSEEGVTIHWHGLTHRTNVWMDGVPQITQCAIPSGHTFTYRFLASPAGTFWYHSHVGYQRFDGLTGELIMSCYIPFLFSFKFKIIKKI